MHSSRTLVVMQPTSFCNIDCRYCYLPERARKTRMSIEVVRRVAEAVLGSPRVEPPVTFLWHLGEPLAVPPAFYEEAFAEIDAVVQRTGIACSHSFQTNGTLLNRDWVDLLRRHRVGIGLSVDGPAFIHDRLRVTRAGKGTHNAVVQAIRLLHDGGIKFGAIAVLTDYTLDHADAMFAFFVEHGIEEVAFNIDEIEGVHADSSFRQQQATERYRRFLARFIELSDEHGGALKLREVWTNLRSICVGTTEPYNTMNQPFRILNFAANGDFCTFCPELITARDARYPSMVMGNILVDSLEDMLQHPTFQAVQAEIERGVQRCRETCDYWRFCGGGSPSNKFFEHGRFDVTETVTCRVHKQATIDVLLSYMERRFPTAVTTG